MSEKDQNKQHEDIEYQNIKESMVEIEKRFLRLASIQTILSVAAVFTGVIALYAALTESYAVRKQTAASVWPYVQTVISDTKSVDEAFIEITLSNVGVGPARMHGVMLQYKRGDVESWDSFVKQFDDQALLGVTYGKSDVHDRVLAPQESLIIFQNNEYQLAQQIQTAIERSELVLSYCSIFDDCWLKPFPDNEGNQAIEKVEQCDGSGTDYSL